MATQNLTTNLKLITSVLSVPPTPAQLPLGYMAFGLVNDRASIWGNYNGTVVDMIQSGSTEVEIAQTTGSSTTAVMSQNAVTTQLNLKESLANKNQINGYAGLDSNAKILPAQLPDYIMSNMLLGGTIAQDGVATLSEAFKSKYGIVTPTITLTAADYSNYPSAFFIAQDVSVFTNSTIIGVENVSTGDWIISLGNQWAKIDNTDAVVTVNGQTGVVTINLEGLKNDTITFTPADTRANVNSGDSLAIMLGKLSKWFADLTAAGVLAFQTNVTSEQTPIATDLVRGAVVVPAVASGLSVDAGGSVRANIGDGIKINASNQLEADIVITYAVI